MPISRRRKIVICVKFCDNGSLALTLILFRMYICFWLMSRKLSQRIEIKCFNFHHDQIAMEMPSAKKRKNNSTSTTKWIMLTAPEAKPSSGFIESRFLTEEAVVSLLENGKAIYVPPSLNEMVECHGIAFADCAVTKEGGLHSMILEEVKIMLLRDKVKILQLSPSAI